MSVTVKLEGFRELERALEDLGKSVGKATMRRALIKAAQPLADLARSMAPDDPATQGQDLRGSIGVSTKLSPRQARAHRRMFRDDRAAVEVFVGAGPVPQAHNQEFGNRRHGPQSFMRPAWMQDQKALLDRLGDELRQEIAKSVARAERKAARAARQL